MSIWYIVEGWTKSLDETIQGISEFPDPDSLLENAGASTGVAREFRFEIGSVARDLATIVRVMKEELTQTEESVRLALADMVETDAELADEARAILTLVESAVEPQPAVTISTPVIAPAAGVSSTDPPPDPATTTGYDAFDE